MLKRSLSLYFIILSLNSACGINTSGSVQIDCSSECQSTLDTNEGAPTIKDTLSAKVSGGVFSGFDTVFVDYKNEILDLKLPLPGNVSFSSNQRLADISAHSTLTLNDLDGHFPNANLKLKISDIDSLKKGKKINSFPNPNFKIETSDDFFATKLDLGNDTSLNAWIFLSKKSLIIYFESALNPYVLQHFPLKTIDDKQLGQLSHIPATENARGAYALSYNF